ncbi:MAG: hypothetical protein H0X11_11545 [Betaproteobacteria bacterium]|nr:hypothetical protein [Betaproteobacteria bacterium]
MACIVALAAGCSVVKLSYNNADTLTLLWLNRYVDLDAGQEAWTKDRVREFYVWHRATQLPDYAQMLLRTRTLLQSPVTKADMLALNAEMATRLDVATTKALPDLATLALQLSPEQIAHMERKFEKNNAEFRKDFLDIDTEPRQENRYKTVLWLAEFWFGRFSPEQEAVIKRASYARPLINELWLSERLARQRDLIVVLKRIQAEKPSPNATLALLKDQAVRATGIANIPNAATRAEAEAAAAHAAQLAAAIVNLTTPEQRQRAMDKLQQWADDFVALSLEGR